MDESFSSAEENPVFLSSSIFNPITWPEDQLEDDFGTDELSILKEALRLRVDEATAVRLDGDNIIDKWQDFLTLFGLRQRRPKTFAELNEHVQMGCQRFLLLSLLLMFLDAIPVHTASVERGFLY